MDGNKKVFIFQGSNMKVHAKGPNIDKTINMSSSFRTNPLSSKRNMPRNFEKRSYAESMSSGRSLYYRRETSPTAWSEFEPRNFYQSYYHGGHSQRSTYDEREGSPVSLRSTDSITSMHYIKSLIKNVDFNEIELRSIQQELNMKRKRNGKAKRRRKIRRNCENMRSDDSGEQGSNSSISDDCTSTRTGYSRYNGNYKENIHQSTSSFRTDGRENNINRNCVQKDSHNIPGSKLYAQNNSQNTLFAKHNKMSWPENMGASQQSVENTFSMQKNTLKASILCCTKSSQYTTMSSLKGRFQSGYQFPPMRFKNSITPFQKNGKIESTQTPNKDFVFAKPLFPIRKLANVKPREKLIPKLAEIFTDTEAEKNISVQCVEPSEEKELDVDVSETTQLTTSDMSMRPSFMKRKLFTQTLDVTERKNNSSDSLATDSPQSNIYSALSREKHKTRKLVPTQSLLSRDVNQDDNNLLDLIHKIVPPSQVNTSNVVRSSHLRAGSSKTAGDGDDKWDINSIISTCNGGSVSDTYTDDEIFKDPINPKKQASRAKSNNKPVNTPDDENKFNNEPETMKCHNTVVNKKLLKPARTEITTSVTASLLSECVPRSSGLDAFWDNDVESDYEGAGAPQIFKKKNVLGTSNTPTPKQSSIKSYIEDRLKNSSIKKPKITDTFDLSPVVVMDSTVVKDFVKQVNKQMPKNADKKTIKVSNKKSSLPKKSGRESRTSPVKVVKTRRQINLSSVIKLIEKSRPEMTVSLPNESIRRNGRTKKTNDKKSTVVKITKTPSERTKTQRNKSKTNTNQQDITKSETLAENIKTRCEPKNSKFQKHDANTENDVFCKVLRTRSIDISSSFNSDQFELTGICCVRKSRTPSKRIPFNKSKNTFSDKSKKEPTQKYKRS